MTWKSEAKEFTQAMYGEYCKLCRKQNKPILPYYDAGWKILYTAMTSNMQNLNSHSK